MIFDVDPGQGPVALGAEPHVVDLVAPVVGRRHVVRAGGDPLDRPAELARAPAGQHLLAVDLELGAEAAAHLGGHDADLLLAQAELDAEDHPRDVRDLRGAPHRQLALAPLGDRAARLDRPARGAVVDDAPLDHDVRAGERRFGIAALERPLEHLVAAVVLVDDRRPVLERLPRDRGSPAAGRSRRGSARRRRTRASAPWPGPPRPPGRRSRPCRARAASARARGRRPPGAPTPSGTARPGRPCPRP